MLNPNDNGQTVWTSIDPPFLISIHDAWYDIAVSQELIDWGCFECSVMEPVVRAHQQYPKASLLDIGSNIGQYSLQAAAMNRKAYAFEPFKGNWRRLCHSININKFQDQINLFNSAVMHESTKVKLEVGLINKGGTKVISYGAYQVGEEEEEIVYAHGVTLDGMSEFLPKGQVVLKIDVEGSECKALAGGLDKYLKQLNIVYVAIEWSQERLQECERREEIFALFAKNGLKPYMHMGKGIWVEKYPSMALHTWRNIDNPNTGLFDMAWSKSNPERGRSRLAKVF